MSDLISRADAIAYIDRVTNSGLGRNKSLDYIHKYISSLPSADAVQVVRCGECKDSRVYGKTTQWLACESVMEGQATDPDGYCYLGRKREEIEVEK